MKWTLEKEFSFEAAHQLPAHDGKCKNMHGHTWIGRVCVSADRLKDSGAEAGMVVDFSVLKHAINQMLDRHFDHKYLNESLGMENPTSENIARWMADHLRVRLHVRIERIVIEETRTSRCIYEP